MAKFFSSGKKSTAFRVWMLVWAFSIFRLGSGWAQSQETFLPGDYRTTSAGTINQGSGTASIEQLSATGTWEPALYPLPSAARLYVLHAVQLSGNLQLSSLLVRSGATFTVPAGAVLQTTGNVTVSPEAELLQQGEIENLGVLQLLAGSRLIIQSPTYQASSLVWAGTEEIDASSEVRILNASPNAVLFTGNNLTVQPHGYWFGKLSLAFTQTNTRWHLTNSSATLAAQAFSAVLPAGSSLLLLDGPALSLSFGQEVSLTGGSYFLQNQNNGTASLSVPGHLTLQGASFILNQTASATAVSTIDLKGNLVLDAASSISNPSTVEPAGGIRFVGNNWQLLQSAGSINHVSLEVKSGALVRLGNHLVMNPSNSNRAGTFFVENGGTLDFSADAARNAYQVQGQGYFKLEQGGTLHITSPQGLNASGATGNVVVAPDGRRSFNQVATFLFNATVPQQTGNAFSATGSGKIVIIDNPTSVTITQSIGISNNKTLSPDGGRLEIRQGTLIASETADVQSTGKLLMSGGTYRIAQLNTIVPVISGTYEFTGGTIELAGHGNQSLRGKTYPNVIISGSNVAGVTSKTISTTTTITQNLSIRPNAILDVSSKSLKGDGGLQMAGGVFRISRMGFTVPELTGKASPYTLTGGTIELYGTLNGQNQSVRGTYGNAQKVIYHDLVLNAAEANTATDEGNFLLQANLDVAGTMTVNAPAVLQIGSTRAVGGTGNFVLQPGATLWYGSAQGIKTSGTSTTDGNIRVSGTRSFSPEANYGLVGSGDMVTGNGLPGTVANLLIAKSTATSQVKLSQTVRVAQVFTHKSGLFTTDVHELSLLRQEADALQTSDPAFYIQGKLRRAVGSSGTYTFPIGDATGKHQLELLSIGLSGNGFQSVAVSFKPLQNHQDADMVLVENNYQYSSIKKEGVWHVEPNAQPSSGTFTAMASLNGFTGLEDNKFALLIRPLASTSGKDWQTGGGTLDLPNKEGRTVASGFAKRNFISPFGQLGLAVIEPVSVLPVSWLYVKAERKNQHVHLAWATASEMNNDRFEIEYSLDGRTFQRAGTVAGAGNSTTVRQYQFQHLAPATATTYYRIKQIDLDEKFEHSKVVAVKPGAAVLPQLTAYPNPSSDFLHLANVTLQTTDVVAILDASGRRVEQVQPTIQGGIPVISVQQLPAGNYILQVQLANQLLQYRFVKL